MRHAAMIFQSDEDLKAALGKWQRRLRLCDWDIRVRIVRSPEMKREANAEIAVWVKSKRAMIQLVHPEDYALMNDSCWSYDMERCLVHEMLHIPMRAFAPDEDDDPEKHMLMEQFIECTAAAFTNQ